MVAGLRLLAGKKNGSMYSHYQEGDGVSDNRTEGANRTKLVFSNISGARRADRLQVIRRSGSLESKIMSGR